MHLRKKKLLAIYQISIHNLEQNGKFLPKIGFTFKSIFVNILFKVLFIRFSKLFTNSLLFENQNQF